MHSVASQRVHFDPLSLTAGIHSFTYTSHVDEETASGPLYAIGGLEGDGGDEAMRGSVRGSRDVHNGRTDYGSVTVVGVERRGYGQYGRGTLL